MWRPVTEEELQLYVDGRLPHARDDAIEAHLDANPRDATRIEAYCRQNALLRALADAIAAELPRAGEERLRRIVEQHMARIKRRRRTGAVAAALVIAAMLGVAGIEVIHTSKGGPVIAGSATDRASPGGVHPVAAVSGKGD